MSLLGENISNYLTDNFGEDFLHKYEEYVKSSPKYYVRFHPAEDAEKLIKSLEKYGISLSKLPNISNGYSINNGTEVIGKTLEFTLGKYYIQSLSSMIPPLILKPNSEDKVLDLCAAPGSKTTQLNEMMNNRGTLYANEVSVPRLRGLVHNLDKINSVNSGVLNFKGELLSKIYNEYFDKILVDAPCSALGIINKKGEVTDWWAQNRLEMIFNTQLRLLIAAVKMAKVGGEIVYSTCTMTLEENEHVVQKVLDKYPVELETIELPVKSIPGITQHPDYDLSDELSKCHRIIPWEINSEGFFITKLIKKESTVEKWNKAGINVRGQGYELIGPNHKKIKSYLKQVNEWYGIPLEILNQFNYIIKNRDIFYVRKEWEAPSLDPFNRVGTKFGKVDKHNVAHLHSQSAQYLAQYATKNIVDLDVVSQLETYMHGQTIKGFKAETGQKLVRYNDAVLGTAIQTKEGLKSQFPRAMRTGELINL